MNKLLFFVLIIVSIVIYIFLINLTVIVFPLLNLDFNSTINQTFIFYSGSTEVGLGDSVSIGVERDTKWYGSIVEEGEGMNVRQSNFYIFNLIKIPLHSNEINFIYFHLTFLFVLTLSLLFLIFSFFIEIERGYHDYEEME